MSGRKVLIVDDDKMTLLILEEILTNANYVVFKAMSGMECIEQAQKVSPDIIVLDVMMPELDGIVTVLKLKGIEKTKSIPIIMCTAVKGDEDEVVACNLGVAGYVRKTPQMEGLVNKIEEILNV